MGCKTADTAIQQDAAVRQGSHTSYLLVKVKTSFDLPEKPDTTRIAEVLSYVLPLLSWSECPSCRQNYKSDF